jgi:hypothetical protein
MRSKKQDSLYQALTRSTSKVGILVRAISILQKYKFLRNSAWEDYESQSYEISKPTEQKWRRKYIQQKKNDKLKMYPSSWKFCMAENWLSE